MNRKRSHDDLDDADECLPISKRINSLHLEGKTQGICHSQHHQLNGFLNNNNNPEASILPLTLPGGSSLPFPNQLQQANTSLAHHLNPAADKPHTFSPISTDYNYNIASSSNLTNPSCSQPHHLSPQNIYQGASNVPISTGPAMLNVNCGVHHSTTVHQSYPSSVNHQHSHTNHHQLHQSLPSFYSTQSAALFVNHQVPMSSPGDVRLVNGHYTAADISRLPIVTGVAATNLGLGQSHVPVLEEDIPSGPYNPELGMTENPHYYDTNKLLYEAHQSRLQRIVPDYQLHS